MLNTLLWAVAIPLVTVVGAVLAQVSWLLWIGAGIGLIAGAAAAIVAGGVWHRAGAATLAAVATFALGLFSGPTLYEAYAKRYGEKVDALVADTGNRVNAKGTELDVCRVVDTSGEVQDLSNQQNCHGQFKPKQHIILFKDPLGAFKPWAEATDDRGVDAVSLSATGGLLVVTTSTLFYAGMRRRSSQEMDAKKLRKYGPPRRSAESSGAG
ncbi:hypothetical protein ACQUSR_29310 [Streptomyces sp. P1-3]|uniref:hypothetical protein n=1 Tax=Streptomyces sp. P1-3 TaxID=3421658 RepID=UPI003D3696A3